jgi:putative transposon-encoded protein
MRKVLLNRRELKLTDKVLGFIEKRVTPFGTGAKVDCPKEYIGKRVYLIICEE